MNGLRWAGMLMFLSVGSPANAAFTVTSVVPLIADVCDTCAAPQVRLPVAFTGLVADAKVSVSVKDVVLNNRHEYRQTIDKTDLVSVDGGFELQISLKPDGLRDVGTYVVILEFSSASQEPQRTTLQLVRTA